MLIFFYPHSASSAERGLFSFDSVLSVSLERGIIFSTCFLTLEVNDFLTESGFNIFFACSIVSTFKSLGRCLSFLSLILFTSEALNSPYYLYKRL